MQCACTTLSFVACPALKRLGCVWNVMAHAQKPDFVFRRNGRVHLNRRERQFSLLLAAEVCASALVMLDALWSEVAWRVLATLSIRQFPLHFPSRASPCAIAFHVDCTILWLRENVFEHTMCDFYRCTGHSEIYTVHSPTNALFIQLGKV